METWFRYRLYSGQKLLEHSTFFQCYSDVSMETLFPKDSKGAPQGLSILRPIIGAYLWNLNPNFENYVKILCKIFKITYHQKNPYSLNWIQMAVLVLPRPTARWVVGGGVHTLQLAILILAQDFFVSSREPPSKCHCEERENFHLPTVKIPVALLQTNYHKQGKLKIRLC